MATVDVTIVAITIVDAITIVAIIATIVVVMTMTTTIMVVVVTMMMIVLCLKRLNAISDNGVFVLNPLI